MADVKSSNVKSVDWALGNLYVTFLTGEIYKYIDVPHVMFREILEAKSVGKYLNANIKPRYNFEKVSFIPFEDSEKAKLMKSFDEIVVLLAKEGLVRYDIDEAGSSRVIITGFVCPKCGGDCSSILEALKKRLK